MSNAFDKSPAQNVLRARQNVRHGGQNPAIEGITIEHTPIGEPSENSSIKTFTVKHSSIETPSENPSIGGIAVMSTTLVAGNARHD